MEREDLKQVLESAIRSLRETDQSEKIRELESTVRFLRNDNEQKEIQIIRLETRLADLRNIIVGSGDR